MLLLRNSDVKLALAVSFHFKNEENEEDMRERRRRRDETDRQTGRRRDTHK